MATLLAVVTAKCCSDLALFHIDNQHLSLQCHAVFLFLHLVVRQIFWVIFHLKFILNFIPVLIFALSFTLKAYICHSKPFRKNSNGSSVSSVFCGIR